MQSYIRISIHVLREEDDYYVYDPLDIYPISIHVLREEDDASPALTAAPKSTFLSTSSARRTTTSRIHPPGTQLHFYPRPPRGGRRLRQRKICLRSYISIHVLREEDDLIVHRPVVGDGKYFYPRPPRGGRRPGLRPLWQWRGFLSTSSARRTTFAKVSGGKVDWISIHVLREEDDT